MKLTITNRILLSNSFTWILMAVVSFISFQNIKLLQETADWVNHTNQVLRNTSTMEKLVLDMETGERGFLISEENEFLEPYESGKKDLSKLFDQTAKLVSDNPEQITSLKEIKKSITLWQDEAALPEIEKRREVNQLSSTMEEVMALVKKKTGKNIMDNIRSQFLNFKQKENELLLTRKLSADREVKFAEYVIIFGTTFIIIFSHMLSLFLADTIRKPVKLLKSTIKDMGLGIIPGKIQIESNNELVDLEKSFEQIAKAQKLARE